MRAADQDGLAAKGKEIAESGKHEPPPEGARLLDELLSTIERYVAFPDDHAAVSAALWITATHALPAFECAPRMVITSPLKRCGKTRLLDMIEGTCHGPLASANATVAAIFRSIGEQHPRTLIIDEADTLFGNKKVAEQNEDLRALLNAGHQRGRPALRCVGPHQIPTEFSTFAMAAIAGIGTMPDTITDRAVNISLRRRSSGEKVSKFRARRDGSILEGLRVQLAAWAAECMDELSKSEPKMPVEDRAADTWEPLIAVADAAGGDWPQRARVACKALVDQAEGADEDGSLSTKLLTDVRTVFAEWGQSFIASADLVSSLRKLDESPWQDFDMTARKLAQRLKPYGVSSERNSTGNVRGYRPESFRDVFARYLADHPSDPSDPSETRLEQQIPFDASEVSDGSKCQTDLSVRQETAAQRPFLTLLTDSDGIRLEDGSAATAFTPPTGPGRCNDCGCHIGTQGHKPDCPANKGVVS